MNISKFQKCADCGACITLCPVEAIALEKSGTFYKPVVNEDKCIDCGLCVKRCPLNGKSESFEPMYAYAGWHKSHEVVMNSSSGGAFHGLAENIISRGGAVYGATYSSDCREVRIVSSDETTLEHLRKSKYVESIVGESFKQVKNDLNKDREVLFCGTPCQVAGLYAFLGERPEKLITCDFACGGLPSHKIYQNYLNELERKYGSEIVSVDFRPKTHGWRRYALQINFKSGKKYNRLGVEDPYLHSFLYGKYTVRDDCLDCKFSDCHAADITIADFWMNIQLSGPDNPDGVSLILCNTLHGREAIEAVRENYSLGEVSISEASYNYKKTEITEEERACHDGFIDVCEKKGLTDACKKYLPVSFKKRLKNYLRRILYKSRGYRK